MLAPPQVHVLAGVDEHLLRAIDVRLGLLPSVKKPVDLEDDLNAEIGPGSWAGSFSAWTRIFLPSTMMSFSRSDLTRIAAVVGRISGDGQRRTGEIVDRHHLEAHRVAPWKTWRSIRPKPLIFQLELPFAYLLKRQ